MSSCSWWTSSHFNIDAWECLCRWRTSSHSIIVIMLMPTNIPRFPPTVPIRVAIDTPATCACLSDGHDWGTRSKGTRKFLHIGDPKVLFESVADFTQDVQSLAYTTFQSTSSWLSSQNGMIKTTGRPRLRYCSVRSLLSQMPVMGWTDRGRERGSEGCSERARERETDRTRGGLLSESWWNKNSSHCAVCSCSLYAPQFGSILLTKGDLHYALR